MSTSEHVPSPPTGAYSPSRAGAGLVFVSGQGPIDDSGQVVTGDIESETRLTLANVASQLAVHGLGWDDVVKVGVYLADIGLFDRFDAVYREALGAAQDLPARTTVAAGLKDILVEIDAVAVARGGAS